MNGDFDELGFPKDDGKELLNVARGLTLLGFLGLLAFFATVCFCFWIAFR